MKARVLVAALALAASLPVAAAPEQWSFSDLTFRDGGTIAGSFTADLATGSLLDWAFSESVSGPIPFNGPTPTLTLEARTWTPANSTLPNAFPFNVTLAASGPGSHDFLDFRFGGSAGGGVPIAFSEYGSGNVFVRGDASGVAFVAAVPEPGTYALLGLGLFALWVARRGKSGAQ
jgi:hypothetical protein